MSAKICLYKGECESCDKVQGTMKKRKGRCELLSHFLLSFQQSPLHCTLQERQVGAIQVQRATGSLEHETLSHCFFLILLYLHEND